MGGAWEKQGQTKEKRENPWGKHGGSNGKRNKQGNSWGEHLKGKGKTKKKQ